MRHHMFHDTIFSTRLVLPTTFLAYKALDHCGPLFVSSHHHGLVPWGIGTLSFIAAFSCLDTTGSKWFAFSIVLDVGTELASQFVITQEYNLHDGSLTVSESSNPS